MIPRFITKEEQTYSKIFGRHHLKAHYFHSEFHEEEFKQMLSKAIKRNSPVTIEELYELFGSQEHYHKFIESERKYYKSWGEPYPL